MYRTKSSFERKSNKTNLYQLDDMTVYRDIFVVGVEGPRPLSRSESEEFENRDSRRFEGLDGSFPARSSVKQLEDVRFESSTHQSIVRIVVPGSAWLQNTHYKECTRWSRRTQTVAHTQFQSVGTCVKVIRRFFEDNRR